MISKATFDDWLGAQDATKAQVMSFLINSKWVRGEARRWGVDVTPQEVRRSFRRLRRAGFETRREYRRYLRRSGLTHRQVLFRVKTDLLSERLTPRVASTAEPVAGEDVVRYIRAHRRELRGLTRDQRRRKARRILVAGSRQVRIDLFLWNFKRRWQALTVCAEGYIVRECSNVTRASAAPTS